MKNTFRKFESLPLRFSMVGQSPPINPLVYMEAVFFLKTLYSHFFFHRTDLMIFPSVWGEGHGVPFQARISLGGNVAPNSPVKFLVLKVRHYWIFSPPATVGVETWYLVEKNRTARQIPACPECTFLHQKKFTCSRFVYDPNMSRWLSCWVVQRV